MKNELIEFGESRQTMSSLEIARLTGKGHYHVMRDIRKMEPAWEKVNQSKFGLIEYKDERGRTYPCYELTKKECLYIATKYNDEVRARLILRWEELERGARTAGAVRLPDFSDPAAAARAWAAEYEQRCVEQQRALTAEREAVRLEGENVLLAAENSELRQDRNYLEVIMRSRALVTVSQIAQDYGMSGKALNRKLADMRIQYSVNGQWVLYAQYKNMGYVSSRCVEITRRDGRRDVVLHTEWTQAGRRFLYEQLKRGGVVPMLERQ